MSMHVLTHFANVLTLLNAYLQTILEIMRQSWNPASLHFNMDNRMVQRELTPAGKEKIKIENNLRVCVPRVAFPNLGPDQPWLGMAWLYVLHRQGCQLWGFFWPLGN
jgi:hypothetical protein